MTQRASTMTARPDREPPHRLWQPLLRARDAGNIDVDALVDQAADLGVDCLVVNAGGFMAWYPTALVEQAQNPYLVDDLLGRFVDATSRRGLQLYGRIDVSKVTESTYQAHPEWCAVDNSGRARRYWQLHETCFTGDFVQQVNFAIVEEILRRYPLDGLFYNFYHMATCYCPRCQALYARDRGAEIPSGGEMSVQYERWRHGIVAAHALEVRRVVRSLRPDARLMLYHHLRAGWDPRMIARAADLWAAQVSSPLLPNRLDPQPMWPLWTGEEARIGRALKPDNPPVLFITYSELFDSRRVLQNGERLASQLAQSIAFQASPCLSLSGTEAEQDDPRPFAAVHRMQRRLRRLQAHMTGAHSPARIGLIWSPDSLWFGPDRGRPQGDPDGHVAEFRGLYAALSFLRYPFHVAVAGALSAEGLEPYDVVIAPAVSCLSGADADLLLAWAERGGHLVLTADTALRDEDGNPRADCDALLFGQRHGAPVDATGGYLSVNDRRLRRLLRGLTLLPIAGDLWPLEHGDAQVDLELVGPYPNNAPEYAGAEREPTGMFGLVTRRVGRGGVTWVPWRIGALYQRAALPEIPSLLRHILQPAIGRPPIATDAPASVEMAYYTGSGASGPRWLVHLLNHTAMADRPRIETIVMPPITLRLRDCAGTRAASGTTGASLDARRVGRDLIVRIPELREHELVVVTCHASTCR